MSEVTEAVGSTPQNTQMAEIPIHLIVESEVALRSVNRSHEKYLGLVDSIRANGVLIPILVREIKDEVGNVTYGLIDGLQRFTASKDAGRSTIPANIRNMNDSQLMDAQIIANLHRIETKPAEYSKQLIRILSANPLMTVSELAEKLSVQTKWLTDRLSLTKLDEKIQELVDSNQIGLSNAYALAKLPPEEQVEYIDRAMTDTPQEFVPVVSRRVKELKDAKHQGRDAAPAEFVPQARLQRLGDVKKEYESPKAANIVLETLGVPANGETLAAWNAALAWVLHLDPKSVEAAKIKDEERRRQREEQRAKAKAEREKRKAEEAAKKQADIANLG